MTKPNGKLDIVQVLSAIVLALIILASAKFLYEVAEYDNPPLEFAFTPHVVGGRFFPGEPIVIMYNYCQHTDAPATIYPSIVDGQVRSLQKIETAATGAGCRNQFTRKFYIPDDLPPGEYTLKLQFVYDVRIFFGTIPLPRTVVQETTPFIVLEP